MKKSKPVWLSNAFIITLAVILVAINVLAAVVPSRYARFDISENKLFSISKQSKSFLKDLECETEIFVINDDGSLLPVEYILSLFDQYSKNLKVSYSIPYDELLAMGVDSIDSVPAYTLVIKGKYRTNYLLQSEMYYYMNETYSDMLGQMSASDYSSIIQTLYQYAELDETYQEMFLSLMYETKIYLDFEKVLLERIEYVSEEYVPHPYYITGHGEPSIAESLLGSSLAGFGCEALELSSAGSLPVDVASLVINSPQSDYSDEETSIISEYLSNGGSLVLITSPQNATMPNLMSIVEKYGASTTSDLIAIEYPEEETDEEASAEDQTSDETEDVSEEETIGEEDISGEEDTAAEEGTADEDDFSEYTKYLFIPTINQDHDSLYELAGQYAYIFKANHIEITESQPTVVIEKLLTVSDAYIEGIEDSTGEKTVAIAIEDATDNGIAKILWFTGGESFADDMLTEVNFYIIAYSLDFCSEYFESQIEDIEGKLMTEKAFAPSAFAYYGLPVLFGIIIPTVFVIVGAIIIKKRKNRKPIEE